MSMDARRVLMIVRRWWKLVLAGTLIAAFVAFGVSRLLPRVYQATALLEVFPGVGAPGGGGDVNELQAAWYQAADDARLIHTLSVASGALQTVQARLAHHIDATTILKNTATQELPMSRILTIVVSASDPNDAAMLANALAVTFIARDLHGRTALFTASLAKIQSSLRYYSRDEADATRQSQQLSGATDAPTPGQSARGEALFERIAVDQEMLTQLQHSVDGIRLYLAGAGSTLSLAQAAAVPTSAISPRTAVNTILGAVLGFVVLAIIAFLIDVADRRPRTAADVAAVLDLPLLGTVRESIAGAGRRTSVADQDSEAADDYRVIRANLGTIAASDVRSGPGHVLAVTGVTSEADASAVAANVAVAAARSGVRTILVDGDPRHPSLHTMFGLPEGAGLMTLLRDSGDPMELVQDSDVAGLGVLRTGRNSSASIDLLGSPRARDIFAALRTSADLVVIHTADAATAAARLLTPLADATILVTELSDANREALVASEQGLRQAGARLDGVIVKLAGSTGSNRSAERSATVPEPAPSSQVGPHEAR